MKSNYLYLLFICIISCLFVSCSDEDNKGEEIPEWNRFRTTNVLVYAHLSEQNLFSSCSYKEVASSIRNTVHAVALLDRTNAVYGQTAIINTGTETARESKKVPVFVPVSYSNGEKKIIGSTVLFPSTISEMTQYVVKNDCRYLETKTEAVNGIDMLFCSVSLNSEDKGEHWHHSKWETFIVVAGHGLIQLRKEGTDEIWNYEVSGNRIQAVHMLPGYTHNIINLSETEDLVTVMYCNEVFNPDRADTYFDPVE